MSWDCEVFCDDSMILTNISWHCSELCSEEDVQNWIEALQQTCQSYGHQQSTLPVGMDLLNSSIPDTARRGLYILQTTLISLHQIFPILELWKFSTPSLCGFHLPAWQLSNFNTSNILLYLFIIMIIEDLHHEMMSAIVNSLMGVYEQLTNIVWSVCDVLHDI